MTDTHETIADIIAAMRDEAARADMEQEYSLDDAAEMMRELAWRLEAAHKRERGEAVTGSNQLREALVKARRFIDSSPLMSIVDNKGTIFRGEMFAEIDAALAAPATAEKSSAVGNAAKLREALARCREIALQWQADEAAGVAGTTDKPRSRSAAEAVIDMEYEINAALAATEKEGGAK